MGLVIGIAIVWFIIEMLLWVLIAQFISGWYVFFWFIVAVIIGINMIRKTAQTLNPMAQQVKSGVIPNPANQPSESKITKSVAMGLAGILLVIPGLLSDVVAAILLLPAIQKMLTKKAKDYAMKNQDKMMAMMARQMGGQSPFGGAGSPFPFGGSSSFGGGSFGSPFGKSGVTVDGEAKTINKTKRISPANDD